MSVMAQVRAELKQWKLTRVVWVTERAFAATESRRTLQRAGGHYLSPTLRRSGWPRLDRSRTVSAAERGQNGGTCPPTSGSSHEASYAQGPHRPGRPPQ